MILYMLGGLTLLGMVLALYGFYAMRTAESPPGAYGALAIIIFGAVVFCISGFFTIAWWLLGL